MTAAWLQLGALAGGVLVSTRLLGPYLAAVLEGGAAPGDRLFRLLALRYPPAEMYSAYLAVRSRKQEKVTVAVDYLDSTLERDWKRFILPLFEAPERVLKNGRDLYGLEPQTEETAVRALVGSNDAWLSACAIAAAGELALRAVLPEIERVSKISGSENAAVAHTAAALLAPKG